MVYLARWEILEGDFLNTLSALSRDRYRDFNNCCFLLPTPYSLLPFL
ncbi:MAG: hypothetical protein F6K55_16245 [Moorea sp. SIO4A3]|nr:hypothetical protein [Moorena sp. SIO4A3]